MKKTICKLIFRTWPFPFGHVKLIQLLKPPIICEEEVTTKLRNYDLKLSYDPNTYIGQFLYYRGTFEESILKAIETKLNPGDTFIDVGANLGLHTIVAAKVVGIKGRVISFEPGKKALVRLEKNVRQNKLTNVSIYPFALGAHKETARLYTVNFHNDGQNTLKPENTNCPSESVEVMTLDSIIGEIDASKGCVLKIDVEGAEMNVLQGAKSFIRKVVPKVIFIECINRFLNRFGHCRSELFKFLREENYAPKILIRGFWVDKTEPIDCDIMAIRKGIL